MGVSLVRLHQPLESLRRAIGLCDGFARLQSNHRVLLKPNIPFCFAIPPYGMVTTTSILESLVHLLAEHGCGDVTIGEGTVEILGSSTYKAYHWTHIDRLARRYGVRLIDLNRGPFASVDLGGVRAQVSTAAFEADFLVNLPVLKTHSQTRVSLGFKNLKGFLSPTSKTKFHGTGRLNELICRLNEAIRSSLTVIDGTYVLENGPDTVLGTAYRKNLIIAGQDAFACDVVGARAMGIDPSEVGYLREYSTTHGRSLDLEAIQVEADMDSMIFSPRLNWKPDVARELLAPADIRGLSVPYAGESLCSRCYATLGVSLVGLISDSPSTDFGGAVICCGKEVRPPPDARKIVLYGDCSVKNNAGIGRAFVVRGCPPSLARSLVALWTSLHSRREMLRAIPVRVLKLAAMRAGIYSDRLPKWRRYQTVDFDRTHFSLSS
jgi:uncharacterized protein (DUF362 family)